jgi:hypothetical protein
VNIDVVRKVVWHFIHPTMTAAAGMNLGQLKQFIASTYPPTEEQLMELARYIRLEDR